MNLSLALLVFLFLAIPSFLVAHTGLWLHRRFTKQFLDRELSFVSEKMIQSRKIESNSS